MWYGISGRNWSVGIKIGCWCAWHHIYECGCRSVQFGPVIVETPF